MAEFMKVMEDWSGFRKPVGTMSEMALAATVDLIINKD